MADFKIKDYTEYGINESLNSKDSTVFEYEFTDSIAFEEKFESVAQRKTSAADSDTGTDVYGRIYSTRSGNEGFFRIVLAEESAVAFEIATSVGGAGGAVTTISLGSYSELPGAAAGGATLFTIPGYISPSVAGDGLYDLGSAVAQWKDIYLINAPVVSSDRRFKEEIKDLEYGLYDLDKLRPVSFKRKGETRTTLGFIAQEVEDSIPEAVTKDESGRYGLREQELIPVLVKAVQQLTARVRELEMKQEEYGII